MEPDSRIKELLEKYWLAETSEEEELELKAYFSNLNIPAGDPEALLFNYFTAQQELKPDAQFDEKLLAVIKKEPSKRVWLMPLLKVAAVLVIVLSLTYFLMYRPDVRSVAVKQKDTYDDPQKAYQETKKALLLMSQNLNAGNVYVMEIKKINRPEQIIQTNENQK